MPVAHARRRGAPLPRQVNGLDEASFDAGLRGVRWRAGCIPLATNPGGTPMRSEPQITFRNMSSSDAVEADIRRRVVWLERFHPSILACQVAVEAPGRHHRSGGLFRVRLEVHVPGAVVVISRWNEGRHEHEDVYVALRDAFHAARRELMDRARMMRGDVKEHMPPPPEGRIVRVFDEPRGRYGFLQTVDGREVYFHEHALDEDWHALHVGDLVRFVEEDGDRGPQASAVERLHFA